MVGSTLWTNLAVIDICVFCTSLASSARNFSSFSWISYWLLFGTFLLFLESLTEYFSSFSSFSWISYWLLFGTFLPFLESLTDYFSELFFLSLNLFLITFRNFSCFLESLTDYFSELFFFSWISYWLLFGTFLPFPLTDYTWYTSRHISTGLPHCQHQSVMKHYMESTAFCLIHLLHCLYLGSRAQQCLSSTHPSLFKNIMQHEHHHFTSVDVCQLKRWRNNEWDHNDHLYCINTPPSICLFFVRINTCFLILMFLLPVFTNHIIYYQQPGLPRYLVSNYCNMGMTPTQIGYGSVPHPTPFRMMGVQSDLVNRRFLMYIPPNPDTLSGNLL